MICVSLQAPQPDNDAEPQGHRHDAQPSLSGRELQPADGPASGDVSRGLQAERTVSLTVSQIHGARSDLFYAGSLV